MSAEKIPLVSVIIPMYNSAPFISQTLESLFYQTMRDFEVIVVDDCSTDNSVAIVESLAPRLGGGLHVVKLPENTGTPGVPRNVGINFARGKYLAFLDSDDLFTPTALQELTILAENFQADAINMTDFFCFDNEKLKSATIEEIFKSPIYVLGCRKPGAKRLQAATFLPDNIAERVNFWLNNEIHWATCGMFCKRDFIVANQIRFPVMNVCEDQIFAFACLCLAKKFLRAPNITYICRKRAESISHRAEDITKYFHKWLKNLNVGFNEFNNLMGRVKFFASHPDYRFAVLNWFFERVIMDNRQISATYAQVHPAAINPLVEKEFHCDDAAFAAYLFNVVNIYRLQLMQLQAENIALKKSLAQR